MTANRVTAKSRTAMRGASTLGLLAFCATLAACPQVQPKRDAGPGGDSNAELESIALTPREQQVIPLGASVQYRADGTFSDGSTRDITADVTWASMDPTVAGFTSTAGRLSSVATGTTTITAELDGKKVSGMATVTPKVIVKIDITPDPVNVTEGMDTQLTATATYSDGSMSDVTFMANWHCEDSTKAAINSTGSLSAVGEGNTTCVANIGSVTDSVVVTVVRPIMLSLDVTGPTTSAPDGVSFSLTAMATFNNETTIDVSSVATWVSSAPAVATVDATGKVKCVGIGNSTITATSGTISDTQDVTCSAPAIKSLVLTPAPPLRLPAGASVQLVLTATYTDDSVVDITADPSVMWASNRNSVATVTNPGGYVTSHLQGSATITATVAGAPVDINTVSVTITVDPHACVSMEITRSDASTAMTTWLGVPVQYVAKCTYTDGAVIDLTTSAAPGWTSSDTTVANVQLGLATTVARGTTTIKVAQGAVSAVVTLEVTNARLDRIDVAPPTSNLPLGATRQMTANGFYSDGTMADVTAIATWSSGDATKVSVSNTAPTIGLVKGLTQQAAPVQITATVMDGQPVSGFGLVTVTAPQPASITVQTANGELPKVPQGLTLSLVATVTLTDGTTSVSTVSWTSGNSNTASVSNAGLVTGRSQGMVRITASLGSISGFLDITVDPPTLVSLVLGPPGASVAMGATLQLTATGVYSNSTTTNLAVSSTWSTSDASVATVSGGLVQTVSEGTVSIGATFHENATGNDIVAQPLTVTVTPPTLVKIEIVPLSPVVPKGAHQAMTATGTFTDMSVRPLTDLVTWSSTNPLVASIDASGEVIAVAEGSVTIEALSGTVNATTVLTVSPHQVVKLEIDPPEPKFPLGTTLDLTVTATYTDGATADLSTVVDWSSSDDNIATVDAGTAYSARVGLVTVTATLNEVSTSVVLEVQDAALVSIDLDPLDPAFSLGLSQEFIATGTFTDGHQEPVTHLVNWATANPVVATVSDGIVQSRKVGVTTITASNGGLISATTSVTITPALITSLRVEPTTVSLPLGRTANVTAIATFTNGDEKVVTLSASWSSTDDTIATISADGVISTGRTGSVIVTASMQGQPRMNGDDIYEATVDVTVTPAVLDRIVIETVDGSPAKFPVGKNLQLKATGIYSDQTEADITTRATWTSENTAAALVGAATGLVTAGPTTGTSQVHATYQSVDNSIGVTVVEASIVSIKVTPLVVSVALGQTQQMAATATYTDGHTNIITLSVAWAMTEDGLGIASVEPTGLLKSLREGGSTDAFESVRVTATAADYLGNPVVGSAPVQVRAKELVSLAIAPSLIHLALGRDIQATLTGTYTDGSINEDLEFDATWSTQPVNTTLISVSSGYIHSLHQSVNPAQVVAKLNGVTSPPVNVYVDKAQLVSLFVYPSNPAVPLGGTQQMTAQGLYSDDQLAPLTSAVTWSTSDPLVATVDRFGNATAVGVGLALITATLDDVAASTQIIVGQHELVELQLTPGSVTLPYGLTKQMKLMAVWSDGQTLDVTCLARWVTVEEDVATVTDNTSLPDGSNSCGLVGTSVYYNANTTVSATYPRPNPASPGQFTLTANATVRVVSPIITSIKIQPSAASVPVPLDQQFTATATFSDTHQEDVTQQAFWFSSDFSKASVTNGTPPPFNSLCNNQWGCVKALTPGTVVITATIGAIVGTVTVAIGNVEVHHVEIEPVDSAVNLSDLAKGNVVELKAIAYYTNGDTSEPSTDVVWGTTQPSIAGIDGTGYATLSALNQGGATISATFSGKTGTVSVHIGPVRLDHIEISPVDPTLYAGQAMQLTVTAVYSDRHTSDVTGTTTWETDDTFTARVSSTGLLKGYNEGEAHVTGTYQGKTATIFVTVGPAKLVQVQIIRREEQSPLPTCSTTTYSGTSGLDFHFQSIARYSDGSYSDVTTQATWAITPVSQTVACSPQNPCYVVFEDGTVELANYGLHDGSYIVRTIFGNTGTFKVQAGFAGSGGTVTGTVDMTIQ